MMKKITTSFIALSMLLNATPAFALFGDVAGTDMNYNAIDYVKSEGIVSGYPDGSYKPRKRINRAELTKIVVEAIYEKADIDACDKGKVAFPDVPKDAWFAKYVCKAKLMGIIAGYPDGTFRPDRYISFVEAAKIIVIAFGHQVGSDTVWYKPFVNKMGMLAAIPTDVSDFNHEITRGQMAEMIYRIRAKISNKKTRTYASMTGGAEDTMMDSTGDSDADADEFVDILDDLDLFDDLDDIDIDEEDDLGDLL